MNESRGDLMAKAERYLERHPEGALVDRVAMGVVICSGADPETKLTFGDVARLLDVPASEVLQALLALRDQRETQ